jgi:multimeric flavodoxin WrbA
VAACGSSYTRQAVRIALQGAEEVGAQTRLIDLRDYDLIFCDGKEDESTYPEGVFHLRSDVKQAQGSFWVRQNTTAT